jgi:hypothetical protein
MIEGSLKGKQGSAKFDFDPEGLAVTLEMSI